MTLLKSILYLFTLAFLVSCFNKSLVESYKVGQCFQETHTNYASYAKQKNRIYKIDEIANEMLKVSIWYSKYWIYQGEKRANYFTNRSTLKYEETNCPGGRKNASITDKIRGIELNE